jgi:hypothetical protein
MVVRKVDLLTTADYALSCYYHLRHAPPYRNFPAFLQEATTNDSLKRLERPTTSIHRKRSRHQEIYMTATPFPYLLQVRSAMAIGRAV